MSASATQSSDRGTFSLGLGEVSGAVADLGVFVPLATALILVNGLDAASVLLCAGLLYAVAGSVFRIPFPVQPLKALTAIAVARALAPDVIFAAGIELGACLLVLAIGGSGAWIARAFTKPVIRSLQLGVGALLAIAAWRLIADPPSIFASQTSAPVGATLAVLAFAGAWVAGRFRQYWIALGILVIGVAASLVAAAPELHAPTLTLPSVSVPPASAFATAFLLLVVPQLPLTFGNAVVAVDSLAHEEFGERASRVSIPHVLLSGGSANIVSGLLGGMPMCHGSGGLTAHVRLGARTAGMNLVLGGSLIGLGLFWAQDVPALLGTLPVWVLGGFLAYAGLRHALLANDLRGWELGVAVVAAALGVWFANLAITAALALVAVHVGPRLRARLSTPDTL